MQVLVSVSSVQEAQVALSAGVRLVDLKETSYGALAALDLVLSDSIVKVVNAYRDQSQATDIIVSATIGDDCKSIAALTESIQSRLSLGIDVIKLPEAIWMNPIYQTTIATFLAMQLKLIAVLSPVNLVEGGSMKNTVQSLASLGYWGVMVDTIEKSHSLTTLINLDQLALFVRSAKALNLYVGLAGGLRLEQFDELAELQPDYLGFRSGLCENQRREQSLIPEKVQQATSKLYEIC
jgi:(5-formylfuran-3-yl)methyl phosphate synthase